MSLFVFVSHNGRMITRLLLLSGLVLLGACMLATVAARSLGGTQPANPTFRGFVTDCIDQPQPCWYGIKPGVTGIQDAGAVLEMMGYYADYKGIELSDRMMPYRQADGAPGCADVYFGYQVVGVKTVVMWCMTVRVGDLMAVLGVPDSRVDYGTLGEDWIYGGLTVRLLTRWTQTPFTPIDHMRLVLDVAAYTRHAKPWHGFLPRWKYCQLETGYEGCER